MVQKRISKTNPLCHRSYHGFKGAQIKKIAKHLFGDLFIAVQLTKERCYVIVDPDIDKKLITKFEEDFHGIKVKLTTEKIS